MNKPAQPRHETSVFIPELDTASGLHGEGKKAQLHCSTAKSVNGGIYSSVNVQFVGNGLVSFEIYGDYRRTLEHDRKARATQKALATQYARNFTPETVAALVDEAKAFYANKAVKREADAARRAVTA